MESFPNCLVGQMKLSDWHQLWFTSVVDSCGNGQRLNTSRPSIPQGAFGGIRYNKYKSHGKLSNGWTDWHQTWHTSADPSGKGNTPNKLPLMCVYCSDILFSDRLPLIFLFILGFLNGTCNRVLIYLYIY